MGKRGPQAKPASVHKRRGTYRASRHGGGTELEYKKGSDTPPKELSAAAKKEWKRLLPELKRLGLWNMAHYNAFSVYCQAVSDYFELTKVLNKMTADGSLEWSRLRTARNKAEASMREIRTRFGFTPSEAAGVPAPEESKEMTEQERMDAEMFGGLAVVK